VRLLRVYCGLLFAVITVSFVLYVGIVLFNHRWDWDHFYSMMAVGLGGWLTEWSPPLWSYQLCGGISRIADPQDFALSPIFVFIFLFGPFWGVKALLVALFSREELFQLPWHSIILMDQPTEDIRISKNNNSFCPCRFCHRPLPVPNAVAICFINDITFSLF